MDILDPCRYARASAQFHARCEGESEDRATEANRRLEAIEERIGVYSCHYRNLERLFGRGAQLIPDDVNDERNRKNDCGDNVCYATEHHSLDRYLSHTFFHVWTIAASAFRASYLRLTLLLMRTRAGPLVKRRKQGE